MNKQFEIGSHVLYPTCKYKQADWETRFPMEGTSSLSFRSISFIAQVSASQMCPPE